MLKEGNRDGLSEAFWAFVAGALAAAPAASEALWKAFIHKPPEPLNLLHLFEVLIVFGCVVLAIGAKVISTKRGKRITTLVEDIRARTSGS